MPEINHEKWKQYHQLTVDEAMNLISGFEPGTYKFCGAKESEMPPNSVHIYRALVDDFKKFNIITQINGETADWPNICRLVHPDEFFNPYSSWWATALLQVADIKDWLKKRGFKSDFFDTDNADNTEEAKVPDCLNDKLDKYPPKLAAAVQVWEEFSSGRERILPGRTLKQCMEKWLEGKADEFNLSNQAIEEIAKVANWETKGGAPKQ